MAAQTLLNQRQEYISERSKELSCFEKELEKTKTNLEEEHRALREEKSDLDLKIAALATREEVCLFFCLLNARSTRPVSGLVLASNQYSLVWVHIVLCRV